MYTQSRKLLLASGIALAVAGMSNTYAAEDKSKDVPQNVTKADKLNDVTQDVINARQETQIWTTYALSPYLRANDIQVSVEDGKATLTGTVEEDVNKDLAKQIALGVNGIKDVDNQIEVRADYVPSKRTADRSYGEVIDDASITAAVKSKLAWSKHASVIGTDVDTKSGKVTLEGNVDSKEAKAHANNLALNTRGVLAVDNKLKVDNSAAKVDEKDNADSDQDLGQGIADTWITTKVKSTFMYSSNVDSSDINVSTSSGVVTLSGNVASGAEQALAIELAQNIRGVNSVVSKDLLIDNPVASR